LSFIKGVLCQIDCRIEIDGVENKQVLNEQFYPFGIRFRNFY
jgi:hypothetical protein